MNKPTAAKKGGFLGNLLPPEGATPKSTTPPAASPDPVGEGPELPTEKLTTKLTRTNDRTLRRAAYWKPGKAQQQTLVNDALAYYFTHVYEGNVSETPEEK
jgi:hypothetical protein